jgi:hypothetical protein
MKRTDGMALSKMFESVCRGQKCCEAFLSHFTQFGHASLVIRPFPSPRWRGFHLQEILLECFPKWFNYCWKVRFVWFRIEIHVAVVTGLCRTFLLTCCPLGMGRKKNTKYIEGRLGTTCKRLLSQMARSYIPTWVGHY